MNNKFSLSFGISLLFVGLLNLFFETSNIIIFGLSISTMIFSIINFIVPRINSKKVEYLYILPFVILISIFCYSNSFMKIDIIKQLVNSKINSILTFISFGFLFISEYVNHKRNISKQRDYDMKQVTETYEYSNLILHSLSKYLKKLVDDKIIIDNESKSFFEDIINLCDNKAKLADIDSELLELKQENYSIQDFNDAYKKNNDIINMDQFIKILKKILRRKRVNNVATLINLK